MTDEPNYTPGGITNGPSSTVSGLELADEWYDRSGRIIATVQPWDGYKASDGRTWAWCALYMDMDYEQAFLLEVRTDDETYDYFAVFIPSNGGRTGEWYGKPKPIHGEMTPDERRDHTRDAYEWFIDWVVEVRG